MDDTELLHDAATTATTTTDPFATTNLDSIIVTTEKITIMPPPPQAPDLLFANAPENKLYWDRSHYDSPESQKRALAQSRTVYVGNLAFTTRSSHIIAHFRQVGGPVTRVVLGLDRFRKTPCGFCFVEYSQRRDALLAVANLSGTKLDGRVIRVELDAGFQPGRQFGRGVSGGQVRDERRATGRVPDAAAAAPTTPRNAGSAASGSMASN